MFNPYQKAVLKIYEDGEYAHVTTMDEVNEVSDGLFTFIMRELGDDCDSQAEAERRIEVAISQLDEIFDRLEQEIEDE